MQALASPSPRPAAFPPSAGAAPAGRWGQTRLFQDYRTAFEGATGLSLNLIEVPPCLAFTNGNPVTRRQKSPGSEMQGAGMMMMSYVPVPFGNTIGACLQLGPFTWRGGSTTNDPAPRPAARRAINRQEHRSMLRLLRVFALQLADANEGLMLGELSNEPPFIEAARAYIADHLTEELALTTVAAAVHISPYYFCKRFHESTGMHFTEYVNRSRVARVKERLLNPHVHVSEAAYDAGFQSLSQFNRAFRRVVGEAPSDFRHRLHARPRPSSPNSRRGFAASTLEPTFA